MYTDYLIGKYCAEYVFYISDSFGFNSFVSDSNIAFLIDVLNLKATIKVIPGYQGEPWSNLLNMCSYSNQVVTVVFC